MLPNLRFPSPVLEAKRPAASPESIQICCSRKHDAYCDVSKQTIPLSSEIAGQAPSLVEEHLPSPVLLRDRKERLNQMRDVLAHEGSQKKRTRKSLNRAVIIPVKEKEWHFDENFEIDFQAKYAEKSITVDCRLWIFSLAWIRIR